MKYILLGLFLIPTIVLGQDTLKGLGPFKIGITTTSIITDIAKEKKMRIEDSDDGMDTNPYSFKPKARIYLLHDVNPKKKYAYADQHYSTDPSVKVYYISSFEISGVKLERLYLSFIMDTLFKLTCASSSELTDAFKLKYGPGEIKKSEKEITCTSRIRGDYKEKELTFITTWDSQIMDIVATDYLHSYYNSSCEENFISYFSIENIYLSEKVVKAEIAIREKQKNEDEKKKKEQLKDF